MNMWTDNEDVLQEIECVSEYVGMHAEGVSEVV